MDPEGFASSTDKIFSGTVLFPLRGIHDTIIGKMNYFGGKDYVNFILLLEMDKTLKLYTKVFHSEIACDFNAYIPLRKEKCSKNACNSPVSTL